MGPGMNTWSIAATSSSGPCQSLKTSEATRASATLMRLERLRAGLGHLVEQRRDLGIERHGALLPGSEHRTLHPSPWMG